MTGQLKTLHGKKVITIHNGFDDEDYREEVPLTRKFTITYTGNIYPKKRDPTTLFKALAELMAEGKIASSDLEVRFFGGNTLAALLPIVEACHVGEFVKIYGFVPFKESVRRQKESTVLLLLLWTDVGEKGIYTGKFFEYLGARRPILAIGPRYGVVDKLLKESGAGIVVNKVKEIKAILSEWIEEFEHSGTIRSNYKPDSAVLYQFMRRKQAEKLAHILDKVTKQQDVKMV
jgi:glycosyltransferase involved in cell wall biosynthesis